jgi:hypothetical protein
MIKVWLVLQLVIAVRVLTHVVHTLWLGLFAQRVVKLFELRR